MECMGTFMECPDMSIHGMQWSNTTGVDFTEVNPGFISLFLMSIFGVSLKINPYIYQNVVWYFLTL